MKIKLANGSTLFPDIVMGERYRFQGADRDTLSFVFPGDTDLSDIDVLFTANNCKSVVIYGDDETENIYNDYTIRKELKKIAEEVAPASSEAEAVYEDKVIVSMSQMTYMEKQLAELQAAVANMTQG